MRAGSLRTSSRNEILYAMTFNLETHFSFCCNVRGDGAKGYVKYNIKQNNKIVVRCDGPSVSSHIDLAFYIKKKQKYFSI